jgi:hypothetical protein
MPQRQHNLSARCTPSERQQFDALVAASGMNATGYILECCLNPKGKAPTMVPDINIDTYMALGEIRTDIEALLAKIEGQPALTDLLEILAKVRALRQSIVGLTEVE